MTRFKLILSAAGLFGITSAAGAQAQITVETDLRPGLTPPIWVSVSGFTGEAADVIRFDLYVQGFNFTNAEAAQYLISGSNSGNLTGRVTDRFNKSTIATKSYTGGSLRRQAHWFTDDIVQATTGKPGIGKTKIAFKVDTGGASEIYMADFDGHNAQAITRDNSLVAAPAWVPGRMALCYASYKLGSPKIFYHNLSTGERPAIARYPGSNFSPAPSPDGSRVAMILDKGGSPDVYVSNISGDGLLQLTKTREDDSSPCWSPDGRWVCFATKINERRSLCKVPASGGPAQRISTQGASSPSEPDWSPDGKLIVFTQMWRDFQICAVPAGGGPVTVLVEGEDPSWAPNSRTVVFARRVGGRRVLSLLDVPTKQFKDVSRVSGSNSQPSWAK